jgi:hypothetical protein
MEPLCSWAPAHALRQLCIVLRGHLNVQKIMKT